MPVRLLVTIEDEDRVRHDAELHWAMFVHSQVNTVGHSHRVEIVHFDDGAQSHFERNPPIWQYEVEELGVVGLKEMLAHYDREKGKIERPDLLAGIERKMERARNRLRLLTENDKVLS